MRRLAAVLLLAGAASAEPPAKASWEALRPAAQEYFTAADDAGRKAAMEKLKAAGLAEVRLTKAQAEAAEKLALAGNTKAKGRPGTVVIDVEAADGKHAVHVHAPPGLSGSKPAPLIVGLHGGGPSDYESGKKHAGEMLAWFQRYTDPVGAVVVLPASPNWGAGGLEAAWKAVDHARATFNIDPNRIMVYGGSMGGFGASAMASERPTAFAMAAPFLGCSDLSGRAADFRNLAFYIEIGEVDMDAMNKPSKATAKALKEAGCDVTFIEQAGKGHEVGPKEYPPFMAKFAKTTRNMHAKKLTRAQGNGRWYWLDAPGPLEATIEGQTVTLQGPDSATVWLSDRMLDLEQPVKIVVNGATKFEGKVSRSLAVMMDEIEATGDRGRTYTARVEAK
ncbi:MAG: prolyl oligopeptidase family serine peptidase [Planctomycetia bacterium]|nr:prolyl oligopeptidase family serine peptidase [Planctomycetia bacterium]